MGSGQSSKNKLGKLKETLGDHEKPINCMCLSEDGSMLVTGSDDTTARMWSTLSEDTTCVGVLRGHSSFINAVAVQDTNVVTGSADSTIRKWDMATCECLFVYVGHTARVQKLLVTSDFIFSTSYDKTIRAWLFETEDLDEGNESKACVRVFKGHRKGVLPLIFIPSENESSFFSTNGLPINPGDILISGSADGTARSWSLETAGCLKIFKGHTGATGAITVMATDNLGKILLTGSADSTIRSYNIFTGQCLRVMEGHTSSAVTCFIVTSRLLYSGSADGTAKCWVVEFGNITRQYTGHKHSITCMKLNNGVLFTGCGDGIVRAFDAKTALLKRVYHGHQGAVNCLMVVGDILYSGSSDCTIRAWDGKGIREDLNVTSEPPVPAVAVKCPAFVPEDEPLVNEILENPEC